MQELSRTGLFQRVLDACWRDAKYVVVTTNLPPGGLLAYVGKAAYERLVDSVGGDPLWVHGEDVRRGLREQREREWAETVARVKAHDDGLDPLG
jgi:hypothetical protein